MNELLCQELDIVCRQELLNRTWANNESGVIDIGTLEDDVIEITGAIKTGVNRTTFKVVVTHDDEDLSLEYELLPDTESLHVLFTSVVFDGHLIKLNYDVPDNGYMLKIKGIIKIFKF